MHSLRTGTVIDHFNHRSTASSDIQYLYWLNKFQLNIEDDFAKGDQVYISYGPYANDALLQYYGFVEDGNVHDTVEESAFESLGATSLESDTATLDAMMSESAEGAGAGTVDSMRNERLRLALRFRIGKKKLLMKKRKGAAPPSSSELGST